VTGVRSDLLSANDAPAAGALLTASHGDYPAFRAVFPTRGSEQARQAPVPSFIVSK
jgi:hypothetical protein